MRARSARISSASVESMPIPALPRAAGTVTTSKLRRWPATTAGSRPA